MEARPVDVSFGTIWEAIARDQPDTVAISEPDRDYTFAEFDDRAARLAAALAAAGVGPGDKVGCYLYNGAAYLETVFAAFKLGAVPEPSRRCACWSGSGRPRREPGPARPSWRTCTP
jgi:acyl-CoA synthetase (AMP-forming)/AMP-acid ligase II